MKRTIRAVMTATLLAGSGHSALAADTVLRPLGENYAAVAYGDNERDRILIIADMQNVDGLLAVCGIVVVEGTNASTRRYESKVTRQVPFKVDGQRLRVRTASFVRYADMEAAKAGTAGCSVTKLPWQPGYATSKLKIGGGRISFSDQ